MQAGNKNVKKVVKNVKKAKFKAVKKTPIKPKSKSKSHKVKSKCCKEEVMGKVVEDLAVTAAIAPEDYEHIYNVQKAKQDPQYVGKVKQNIAAGVGLGAAGPIKEAAPGCKEATENVVAKVGDGVVNVIQTPCKEATALPMTTIAIAPDDYVQIFDMKNGPGGPIPNQLQLQQALQDRVEAKKTNWAKGASELIKQSLCRHTNRLDETQWFMQMVCLQLHRSIARIVSQISRLNGAITADA